DVLSEALVDVLVDLLNDAESLSYTDVDFDSLSESLVDVVVDFVTDAVFLCDTYSDVWFDSRAAVLFTALV
ncbi:cell surface protein, partial [Staphylococcus pseudintermedius]